MTIMKKLEQKIKIVDVKFINEAAYQKRYVGCIVLSKDNKIMLQQRAADWSRLPNCISEFGGQIEAGEKPIDALVRELNEELGASVNETDVISLGVVTEEVTNYSELLYVYFWHDKHGTITGCYEGECIYFDTIGEMLAHPKIMDSVRWLLNECHHKKLIR